MHLNAAFAWDEYILTFLATVIASCICGIIVVFILKIIVGLVDIVNNYIKTRGGFQ